MKRKGTTRRQLSSKAMDWVDTQMADSGRGAEIEALLSQMMFAQDLVALREERGLTQVQLAQRAGVKQPIISKIESGRARNIELKTLARLAEALGARLHIRFEVKPRRRTA